MLINIFLRPEEAMFENWQKLVSTEKLYVLFLRISFIQEACCLVVGKSVVLYCVKWCTVLTKAKLGEVYV